MNKDIFVFVEQRSGQVQKVSLELLSEAHKLASQLGQHTVAVVLGTLHGGAEFLCEVADQVILVSDTILDVYRTETYTKAITAMIRKYEPDIFLFGATSIGRDLAPRVAGRVHSGLTADCTALAIDPESKLLQMTRPAFGGNILATIVCREYRPQMATVRPGVMKLEPSATNAHGTLIHESIQFLDADVNVEILETNPIERKSADITAVDVILSGGRGAGEKGIEALFALAPLLNAEVAGSRISIENGWLDKARQVGQTGRTVRPRFYLAAGISGAIQHLVGMENAEFILAINKDVNAPMMSAANLAVEGDVSEILPKVLEIVKRKKAVRS